MINNIPLTNGSVSYEDLIDLLKASSEAEGRKPEMVIPSKKYLTNLDRITVTFHKDIIRRLLANPRDYQRDINAIVTYGYLGRTRGGRNGITDITDRDGALMTKFLTIMSSTFGREVLIEYNSKLEDIRGVKVVVHRKNGLRIFGFLNRDKNRIALLGESRY